MKPAKRALIRVALGNLQRVLQNVLCKDDHFRFAVRRRRVKKNLCLSGILLQGLNHRPKTLLLDRLELIRSE